ncbi:hypothetical protein, conserved [Trypanosoma brucei brucei TREU927]|uniref:Transmembrane protein n=1 Tax=Trypanosoma brucei brucei (strain 927/4 GUTat10.1) TaxID=185431 RepID=Q38BK9_TRYB2|nr:hypothetical protein, conserved [Trypanosoma brucei brucei TREU927]EAN77811.1 hypothetical protein, conserved [Trypanosoma brucei brucei TREU927]
MKRSDDVSGFTSFLMYSPTYALTLDVSIVLSCLLAIACRIKLFANKSACPCTVPSLKKTGNCGTSFVGNYVGHSTVAKDTVSDGRHNSMPEVLQSNDVTMNRSASPSAAKGGCSETHVSESLTDSKPCGHCSDDALGQLFGIPVNAFAATALINYLSLVSNCLTQYFRPSQVLYATLMSFCDVLLFAMSDYYGEGTSHCRHDKCVSHSDLCDGWRGLKLRIPSVPHELHDLKGIADHKSQRRGGSDPVYPFGVEASSLHLETRGNRWRLMILGFMRSNVDDASKPKHADGGVLSKLRVRWYILPILHTISVAALVILRKYQLLFFLGTAAGYVASCVTLHMVGYGLSALLSVLLFPFIGGGYYGTVRLSTNDERVEMLMGFFSLSGAVHVGGVGVYYVLQQTFSGVCVVLYVLMLLEEDDALYSTHVSLMRWYVNPCGQGLLDAQKLFTFLLLLGSMNRHKQRERLLARYRKNFSSHLL